MQPLQITLKNDDGLNYVNLFRRPPVAVLGTSTWQLFIERLRALFG